MSRVLLHSYHWWAPAAATWKEVLLRHQYQNKLLACNFGPRIKLAMHIQHPLWTRSAWEWNLRQFAIWRPHQTWESSRPSWAWWPTSTAFQNSISNSLLITFRDKLILWRTSISWNIPWYEGQNVSKYITVIEVRANQNCDGKTNFFYKIKKLQMKILGKGSIALHHRQDWYYVYFKSLQFCSSVNFYQQFHWLSLENYVGKMGEKGLFDDKNLITHFLPNRVLNTWKGPGGYCTLQRPITYWCKYMTQMIQLSTAFVSNLRMFCHWYSVVYTYSNQSRQPNFLILFSSFLECPTIQWLSWVSIHYSIQ